MVLYFMVSSMTPAPSATGRRQRWRDEAKDARPGAVVFFLNRRGWCPLMFVGLVMFGSLEPH